MTMEHARSQRKLKYQGYSIALQEVPDEISLAVNVSGCPVKCQGCHSKYLWEYEGRYLSDDLQSLIKKYDGLITCICFMGGDQNLEELKALCTICSMYGLSTCLYTGRNLTEELSNFAKENLSYLKVGEYREDKGGLSSTTTNQVMYKITNKKLWNITQMFWNYGY